jgi:hypothetical protein
VGVLVPTTDSISFHFLYLQLNAKKYGGFLSLFYELTPLSLKNDFFISGNILGPENYWYSFSHVSLA